jgi:hypothetical protein
MSEELDKKEERITRSVRNALIQLSHTLPRPVAEKICKTFVMMVNTNAVVNAAQEGMLYRLNWEYLVDHDLINTVTMLNSFRG